MQKTCDIVLEGGGVHGIGFVGATTKLQQDGYSFRKLAGSSAGAIVASLLAAGYTTEELYKIMSHLDYKQFKQKDVLDNFGIVGEAANIVKNFGIYSAQHFEKWLAGLLAQKNIFTFKDLQERLKVTATDISDSKLLVLPDDLAQFGIDPETFSVAAAVRMSMSIPLFFEPYELKDKDGRIHLISDGGMLSNYPVWILDDGISAPQYPVFGLRFSGASNENKTGKPNFLEYLKQIIITFMQAHDQEYRSNEKGDSERTIYISTKAGNKKISSTDFNIMPDQVQSLFVNGYSAVNNFLKTWNFEDWKKKFR